MFARVTDRSGRQAGGLHPSGIIVLDHLPPQPHPQVQAFVWCKRGANGFAIPDTKGKRPNPPVLMVGLASQPNGKG